MNAIASLGLVRVAAALGSLRGVVPAESWPAYDEALLDLVEGDTQGATVLLSRASLGMKDDNRLRDVVLEAWALLDEVEQLAIG